MTARVDMCPWLTAAHGFIVYEPSGVMTHSIPHNMYETYLSGVDRRQTCQYYAVSPEFQTDRNLQTITDAFTLSCHKLLAREIQIFTFTRTD